MLCSVNSTPIAALARRAARVSAISSLRSRGRHAGGRLVHQQQPRLVGERDRQLDALDVAVGQHAASRARPAPPCRPARAARPPRRGTAPRAGARSASTRAGVREQRHLHVLDARSARRRSRRSGRCGRRPGARSRAACRPTQFGAVEPHRAARRAASWPLTMLKQVDLPAPFGPISASISPAASIEAHVVDRAHAAERLAQAAAPQQRRAASSLAPRAVADRTARFSAPAMPSGNSSTSTSMTTPSSARQ